jgi:hypothetical protein
MTSFLRLSVGIAAFLFVSSTAEAAVTAPAPGQSGGSADEWIYLGVVADTSGNPEKWLGDTGFEFADAADKARIVPKIGDRIRLTTSKGIRKTNAQGQRPFERPAVQGDTAGEFPSGTVLKVTEIGRRPTSKAGDRWQCWVRVQR